MYCLKCGSEINDGLSFCPNCGEKIDSPNTENIVYNQMQYNVNQSVFTKPLAKCAWFAPVAMIVSGILGFVIEIMQSVVLSNFNSGSDARYYYVSGVIALISFVLLLLPYFIFYIIASANTDKKSAKIGALSVLILPFLRSIASIISSLVWNICYPLSITAKIAATSAVVIKDAVYYVLIIIFAILSYFIVAKYFKLIDENFVK